MLESQTASTPVYLSEVFLLEVKKPQMINFYFVPEVSKEIGNRISWQFSQKFPGLAAIWFRGCFWAATQQHQALPQPQEWREKLAEIRAEMQEEFGDRAYKLRWGENPTPPAAVESELAARILRLNPVFSVPPAYTYKGIEVKQTVRVWAEEIEIDRQKKPALTLTLHSDLYYPQNLAYFYDNHSARSDTEKLLCGLHVRELDRNNYAKIVRIVGNLKEHRQELLQRAKGAISRKVLQAAPDEQWVVAVQFGRGNREYFYPLGALRPSITAATASRFGVEYGKLLKSTKISCSQRQDLLVEFKNQVNPRLQRYGFEIGQSVNSCNCQASFFLTQLDLDNTKLLFGKGHTEARNSLLTGLKKGGVFRRHERYQDPLKKVQIAVLKIGSFPVKKFIEAIIARLDSYEFKGEIQRESIQIISVEGLSLLEARSEVESAIARLLELHPDVVFVFLPESDRATDDRDGSSLYSLISGQLLRQQVASQTLYEQTLRDVQTPYLINQIVPGVLAKLGNLPFVLAEPLTLADYFMGLDVSRFTKKRGAGSLNVCASVRLYGKRGEFINYFLETTPIEGEEIPYPVLEQFLPKAQVGGKTVLIYRDGRFCGKEVENLRAREKAIAANFILVECYKSGIPRLYNWQSKVLGPPSKGLALRLSDREAVLVTTAVPKKVGLPKPLRLRIIPRNGQIVSLESLIETTLKLTLLHHGSLKEPRQPVPLVGADRIAYRRLQGIAPLTAEGDRQYWL